MPSFLPALRARAAGRGTVTPVNAFGGTRPQMSTTSVSRASQLPGGLLLGAGQPYRTNWDLDRAVREAYDRVVWVYRATHVIADAASRLRIGVREGNPDTGAWTQDDRIERLLNRFPNPWESARSFRYRISSQLVLSNPGVFIEVICDQQGLPVRLMLLPPDRTSPVPDSKRFISAFQVQNSGGGYDYLPPWNASHPMTNSVIWLRNPNPVNQFMSSTPLQAAGIDVDTHYLSKIYNRSFVEADGRPGGIVNIKGQLSPEDGLAAKAKFQGGPRSAGRTIVLEAPDIQYLDTSVTPRDAEYSNSLNQTKIAILSAFGVPESQAGNTAGRTFDNADADEENFWRYCMLGHMKALTDGYDQLTSAGWDDNNFVVHDITGVYVLQREARSLEDRKAADLERGAISVDEYREAIGLKALNTPETRTLWRPAGLVPVGGNVGDPAAVLAEARPIAAPAPPPAAPATPTAAAPPDPDATDGAPAQAPEPFGMKGLGHRARREAAQPAVADGEIDPPAGRHPLLRAV